MENQYYCQWNELVYYVSHVYCETRKFKPGDPGVLGERIRRTVISISADANHFREQQKQNPDLLKIYPILSSISVLETYLQLAKKYNLLKDTSVLDDKLEKVKNALYGLLERKRNEGTE